MLTIAELTRQAQVDRPFEELLVVHPLDNVRRVLGADNVDKRMARASVCTGEDTDFLTMIMSLSEQHYFLVWLGRVY